MVVQNRCLTVDCSQKTLKATALEHTRSSYNSKHQQNCEAESQFQIKNLKIKKEDINTFGQEFKYTLTLICIHTNCIIPSLLTVIFHE